MQNSNASRDYSDARKTLMSGPTRPIILTFTEPLPKGGSAGTAAFA